MTREESIFAEALNKGSAVERDAFLDQACGEDASLRRAVDALLLAHDGTAGILEAPLVDLSPANDIPASIHGVGSTIGPYKLLEQIGGGGMGVVYMAEQLRPVRRKVALKIIKPGMDSGQVIARFEAERQALTMMDHPNIAKVLDAGTTDAGRPYFVMELVKGIPITDYCDQARLTTRERLELFIPVCQAVQHAHQKGVIHRDLKPTNVLVTLLDDKPVSKVIDFGIAKAAGQVLTDKTLFTNYAQMLGTPLYMSPEQAQISGVDVDTRSDVYSLGVLLYELLTGTTPFDKQRLREAAYDEMRRIIREEDPPKPSTRLGTMVDRIASISAQRHTEPKKLGQLVRGELDWIVMKSLEKDRARRYETANGFARDIERHLRDEAVQACPPSTRYRFRKFARRHRAALAGALVLTVAVIVGLGGITGGIGWAMRDRMARDELLAQERTARQAKVTGQLEGILSEVARLERAEKWSEALVAARRAEPILVAGEAPPQLQAQVRHALVNLELVRRLDEIRMRSGTPWSTGGPRRQFAVESEREYATAMREAGIDIDALPLEQAVDRIALRRTIASALLPALDDWVAVRTYGKDAAATRRLIDVIQRADPDPWRRKVRELAAREDWPALKKLMVSADLDRQPAATLSFLYVTLKDRTLWHERELMLRRAQWLHPHDYWINHRLGVDLIWREKPEPVWEGIGFLRAAIAARPSNGHAIMNLGTGYFFLHDYDEAIACHNKAIEHGGGSYVNLGNVLAAKGQFQEAMTCYERAMQQNPKGVDACAQASLLHSSRPDEQRRNLDRATELALKGTEIAPTDRSHWIALGIAYYRAGRWQDSRAALEKSEELAVGAPASWDRPLSWLVLAMCHRQMEEGDPARVYYERAIAWEVQRHPIRPRDWVSRFRIEAEEVLGLDTRAASQAEEAARQAAVNRERLATPRAVAAARQGDAWSHHILGNLLAGKGEPVEAEAAYREAIRLEPNVAIRHYELGTVLRQQRRNAEAVVALEEAVRLRPNSPLCHYTLGMCYATIGERGKAVASLEKYVRLIPSDFYGWYRWGSWCLYFEDLPNYRRACQEMLDRFGQTDDPLYAHCAAKLIALSPDFGADLQHAERLAQLAMGGRTDDPNRKWFEATQALVDYRAGRFGAAADLIIRSEPSIHGMPRDATAFCVLAMAQHHLGKIAEAHAALRDAQALMAAKMPKVDQGAPMPDDWHGWLHAQLLCREAEQLLGKRQAP